MKTAGMKTARMKSSRMKGGSLRWLLIIILASCLSLAGLGAGTETASAKDGSVTNLAHLNFLLDKVSPPVVQGHNTWRLSGQPDLTMPWTYANALPGGSFERVGGGTLDPATGHYSQGAYNTDDVARAAVVYLRHWQQTGSLSSKQTAYQLLRSVAYLQTSTGRNAGNSVLWMQSDGQLNPSAKPVELPDPSDSGPSYWQARTVWALGEGYAAFCRTDPAFASFLKTRLGLSVAAIERQELGKYGEHLVVDGKRVPAWLIINGADASAEASLGLSAYLDARPQDHRVRRVLAELTNGIAQLASGDRQSWPYQAVLPWAESRSMWHAWSSQMGVALARGSQSLHRPGLLAPAIRQSVSFDTTLLTAGGPDNAWYPTPVDTTQIAYGADSRLQSLLSVADVGHLAGMRDLAGIAGAWYFGANRSGAPVYDPATGVTFDGVQSDGTVNHNSGAESTIHGLLSMLVLDAHPAVRDRAQQVARVQSRDGLKIVEAESATTTTGTVVTPASAWTGESQWSGGSYLRLEQGEQATFTLGRASQPRLVEPVSWLPAYGRSLTVWQQGHRPLGVLRHRVGAQGISAVPGALLPQSLRRAVSPAGTEVSVRARRGSVQLDALIVRPMVSRMTLTGENGRTELVHSSSWRSERTAIGFAGQRATVRSYDARGRLVGSQQIPGITKITLRGGGFAVALAGIGS